MDDDLSNILKVFFFDSYNFLGVAAMTANWVIISGAVSRPPFLTTLRR